MADQIIDNRTLVDNADSTTGWVVYVSGGGTSITSDTDVKIQGTASNAEQITSSRRGIAYDAGSTQDWSDNIFYIWVNCGIVGLLDLKSNGGFTIRFAGSAVTDFFEVYVGGNDSWPTTIEGGWAQFVVDIEEAYTAAVTNGDAGTATGGTPPATTAIQHVGITAVTSGTMTKTVDNTWVDEIRRLPRGRAGIIVEGKSGGTTSWTSDDIVTQLGTATGTFTDGPGGSYIVRAPIQFGQTGSFSSSFSDTNAVWLWDFQEYIPQNFYELFTTGSSGGYTELIFGEVTGSGTSAIGSQGFVVSAASESVRWDINIDATNTDVAGFYGSSFFHGGVFDTQTNNATFATVLFSDVSQSLATSASINNSSVIAAFVESSSSFITVGDPSKISNTSFQGATGHAIEVTETGTYTFTGNTFAGYGAIGSGDAAIYNNSGGQVTMSIAGGGTTPTYRNGTGAATQIVNNTAVTLTGLVDNTEIRVMAENTQNELAGIETATDGSVDNRSFTFSLGAGVVVDINIVNVTGSDGTPYEIERIEGYTVPSDDTSLPIQQRVDRNYLNPS